MMENYVFESSVERTFQYQETLPQLPVPSLEESLSKYCDAVKPFLSQEEYEHTYNIVKKFENGIGKELHQKLLERAKVKRNWLEEWWLNAAYLDVRMPSQLNVNFGGPAPYLEHYWPPKEGTQLERGSIAVWYTLKYWDLLRREKLSVHKNGNTPLDMHQFRNLFNTCKIPGVTRDSIANTFKTESEGVCPTHLIVMSNGRIFSFEAVYEGLMLTPPEILRQLQNIQNRCSNEPRGIGLAALTTEERTSWALTREHLINLDPKNASHLERIQSSLFVVSLDDAKPYGTPENYSQICTLALAGDPTIRWGDKSYNCIVWSNGVLGSNCDHAPYDAMVLVAMCDYIDKNIKACEGLWKGSAEIRDLPYPEELVFAVDQKIMYYISLAKDQYYKQVADLHVANYAFTSFGKTSVKKKKLHPDTFVQLALQLAFYKLYQRPGCCYETATTRTFYHGRTETMRPCTMEAIKWCRCMLDPSASLAQRQDLMLKAFEKHNKTMKECQLGKGFDRHLLGLLLIAKEHGIAVPELYADPAFKKSGGGGNFALSTSLVGYTNVHGAVVPMIHNGYGFFYRIRDDRFVVACTAWKSNPETDAEKFCQTVFQNFHEMINVMVTAQL
ncbi:peroxisomal carnitine O-octanoyltransferase [Bombina bombina]|uniref:peroxisomal carnitine O-octanoyltransferase n=1 Tax=Bombina bombina TaxID=8345 RepID=UPI00235A5545|nr:peroxisomal carnitine O-octanoyltransferase [Bombina bombina]XP_053569973.1 peroxisomal carnitine O-octanoyltransferase [Bombina bombina]